MTDPSTLPPHDEPEYHLAAHAEVGEYIQIPLDEAEFNRIRAAREHILTVVLIEEKFGMVLENYFDFEQTLLDIALRYMVFASWDYATVMKTLFLTTRRIQNLLSSARLYLDHTKHDLNSLYGEESEHGKAFAIATSKEYDSRVGYRAMEALRNYMQHRSLSLRYVTVGWRRQKQTDLAVHVANPELDLARISKDGGFKAKVLAELEALKPTPLLKVLVRDYVEGLAIVQAGLRTRLDADTEKAKEIMGEARTYFVEKTGKRPRALHLNLRKDSLSREEFYLGWEFVEHLERLQTLYSRAQYLTKTIVSSEA